MDASNEAQNSIAESVISNLNQLLKQDEIVESRILNTKNATVSGYFDTPGKLAEAIQAYDGQYNVFITMNPVVPSLIARANNHLVPYAKQTTSDADILKREWVLVDIDPQRPSGVSATDEEKQAARELMETIRRYMDEKLAWSEPVRADSGNGYHLLYKIDLPNDSVSRELIKKSLRALDFLFSTDQVKVDISTFNAARIIKLYGTMAVKGDNTADRPHRRSALLSAPAELIPVSQKQLEELVSLMPAEPAKDAAECFSKTEKTIDVEAYLEKFGLEVRSKSSWSGGMRWVLKNCPWNPDHTNGSAFVVQFGNGAVGAGCLHDSCRNETWQTLRSKLEPGWKNRKNAQESSAAGENPKESPADRLIRLAEACELFHTSLGEPYATVSQGKYRRNLSLLSRQFKQWLTREYYEGTGKAVSSDAMLQALGVLEAKAMYDGPEKKLYLRVAGHEAKFFYDLCDSDGNVLEIDCNGFGIATDPPDIFRRTKNMKAQVMPAPSGDARLLANHVRGKTLDDEILFVVTVGTCFIPGIAHPIQVTAGEKGAAKTTTMKMLRRIIDPANRDLYALSSSDQDLALILANNYGVSFDNIDSLSARQSDMLCMASTGGGISKRSLYTDSEETILEFKHCVGLNGINVVATRADLLDRSIITELERIPAKQRKEERVVWESFEKDLPAILGGYFSALAKASQIYPTVQINELPRMADYCRWGYALAEAIGYGGQAFLDAYFRNIGRANENAILEDPVADAVVAFMRDRADWHGYVSKLLNELERAAIDERINVKARRWPKAAHVLTSRLKEVKSNLEEIGITYERQHDTGGTKISLFNANASQVKAVTAPRSVRVTGCRRDNVFDEDD